MTTSSASAGVPSLPVSADQKVARVLKEHPELLEVFTAQSQAFDRLTNPLMRRTFSRMVTVSQAADVAGMPVADLLRALNGALGVSSEDIEAAMTASTPGPSSDDDFTPAVGAVAAGGGADAEGPPAWVTGAPVVAELDARDMQRRGEDPFFAIMDAARGMEVGQSLRLRNTFKPVPLLGVLGAKGFASWAEQLGPEDWLIIFHRERAVADEVDADDTHPHGAVRPTADAGDRSVPADASGAETAGSSPTRGDPAALLAAEEPPGEEQVDAVVTITLEDLTPPVPMQKVLEGLAPLPTGSLLLVHHLRTPPHLTAKLEEYGHPYRIWDLGPDQKEILIHKTGAGA